jgi:pseudaminic acid synthase
MPFQSSFHIGKVEVGEGHPPFILAEMSGNHNQSLDRALALIDAAAAAGAHGVKLQTYTADTMTLKGVLVIEDPNSLWYGRELYDLYEEAHTPWEWHAALFERAQEKGIEIFSSPFDATAVDFLEELGAPAYKVASFENTDHPLLKKVAATGKPVIMSTGASTLAEVAESVDVLRNAGCEQLIVLKCTSTYPASPANSHLRTIPHMREMLKCPIGLSDHTLGIGVPIASVAMGACLIEKHYTLARTDGGVDSAFSLEPNEVQALVEESERAFLAMGEVKYGVQKAEDKSTSFKRSLYVAADIAEGEVFTPSNLRVLRPGDGLPPKYYEKLLGRKARRALRRGEALNWDMII